jgi:hypothetical protein
MQGGWTATKADLAAVPVPPETESYVPVPYPRFVEEVELHIPRFNLTIVKEEFALAKEGNRMFGILTCLAPGEGKDYALAIGLRNSLDRTLSVGLCCGHKTFVCDNLAFSGEVSASRKHTINVFRDLPDMIYGMLSKVSTMRERMDDEIAAMKSRQISEMEAHHLMIASLERGVLPASGIPPLLAEWRSPSHDEFRTRTAWSLFNCFTALLKSHSPRAQMERTLALSGLFRNELN